MVCITTSGGNECGQLAQNRTALQQGQQVFTGLCKAAGAAGGAAGGSAGGMGSMGGMSGMTNETSGGAAAGGASATASTGSGSGTAAPAGHNGAIMQQVATGSIVLTALLAGAATLL